MSWVGAEPSSKQPSKQPRDACGNTVVTQEGTFGPGAAVNMAMGQHRTPGTPVKLSALGGHPSSRLHTHDSSHPHPHLHPRSPPCLHRGDTPVHPTCTPGTPVPFGTRGLGMSKHERPAGRATSPTAPGDSPPNSSTSTGSAEAPRSCEARGATAAPASPSPRPAQGFAPAPSSHNTCVLLFL